MNPDFSALGGRAGKGMRAYYILAEIAANGGACPSLTELGERIGLAESTTGKLLARMDDVGMIRRIPVDGGARLIEIAATGNRTAPTRPFSESGAAKSRAVSIATVSGWPKQTMGQEQFCAALGRAGRFEDSAEARRDPGSPRHEMPPRASVFSPCGISRVYDHGGSGQRDVAGRL